MFNTDLNHFLQQFDSPWLKFFMEFISALGAVPFVLAFILVITFALNFRKGIVLVNIVAWKAMLTFIAKQTIDYPRPVDVDTTLISDDYNKVNHHLKPLLPDNFTDLLSEEVLGTTRTDQEVNYGFPSGHTSLQVALWLGMFFLFRKRWILSLGISITLLTMLSRIYLAHHFLADVVGGLTLGMLVLGLLGILVIRSRFFTQLSADFKSLTILWLPILMTPFVKHVEVWLLGSLLGLNLAATLIILHGNTLIFSRNTIKRITSATFMIGLVFLTYYFSSNFDFGDNQFLQLFLITLFTFFIFRGAVTILKRVNFLSYKI